jgi:membrane-bound lytic murein transglycosylase B
MLNEKQPEFVRPVWDYLAGVITPERIEQGRELIAADSGLFQGLTARFGIPPQILTAIWGIETGYGRNTGSFNLVEALANLAFEGPRTAFGRRELMAALEIAQQQHIDPGQMTGSWAGAFGQTQFIPTTFLKYAIDGNGDGRIDLWNSPADALASTANYLQQSGWQSGQPWGEEVRLPDDFPYGSADISIKKTVADWAKLGVLALPGQQLPSGDQSASILLPAGRRGPAFLVLNNFDVLLKYNSAIPYALAVALLSDRIKGLPGVRASWPVDEPMLDQSSAIALQQGLTDLGFPTGGADGVFGARTRQAVRAYQESRGLPADGFPTSDLLTRVLNERSATR